METAEIILNNETLNDGRTIHLYKEKNGHWSAYNISAFLLCNVLNITNVQRHIFDTYQVKMPVISVSEQEINKAEQEITACKDLLNYKILHCNPDVSYTDEAYFSWLKSIANF